MSNPYLIIPFAAWFIAQAIKFLIKAFQGQTDWRLMYVSGGMPSAHSAVVVALATVAFKLGGLNSPLFGITAIFAAIVMYDALGVRRVAGEQAVAINKMRKLLGHKEPSLRELKGHRPEEVLVGALLGALLAIRLA